MRIKDVDTYPVVIACNKLDLINDGSHERQITPQMLKQWVAEHSLQHAPILDTSAKTKHNCREAFEVCLRQIRHFREMEAKKREAEEGRRGSSKKNRRPSKSKLGLFGSASDSKDEEEDLKFL